MTSIRVEPLNRPFLLRVFLAALALRVIPVLLTRSLGIGLDDMFQYDMLARSLVDGNGYRWYAAPDLEMLKPYVDFDLTNVDYDPVRGVATSFRAPLYPAFLALVYLVSGTGGWRFFAARLAQAVFLSAPLAPLTCLVARPLFPGRERVWRMSAWAVAFYPMLIAFPLALATENLFFPLVLASALMLLATWEKPSTWNFIVSGVLLGLSALTRSVALFYCGLVLIWFWLALNQYRRGVALMFLSMTLTILPWVARNSLLYHRPTGIETALGYQLYLGYHPQSTGTFQAGISFDLIPIIDDRLRDQVGREKALEFIRDDPSRFIPLALNRLGYFFGLERRALEYFYANDVFGFIPLPLLLLVALVFLLPFMVISISGAFGLALARRTPQLTLLMILMVGYLLPHLFIISEERFHMALIPFIAILAAHFWDRGLPALAARWNESRIGKYTVMMAVFLACLLLLNWGLELFRDADKLALLFGPNGNHADFSY